MAKTFMGNSQSHVHTHTHTHTRWTQSRSDSDREVTAAIWLNMSHPEKLLASQAALKAIRAN